MENQTQSFGAGLDESVRSWKAQNPDWRTHASTPSSPRHPQSIRDRREQICAQLASLGATGIHRILIAKGMRSNPPKGHVAEWVESEALTQLQEAKGIHLPFQQEMERCFASVIEVIDSHVLGHLGTETIGYFEDWFVVTIRQPIERAVSRHGQKKRTS